MWDVSGSYVSLNVRSNYNVIYINIYIYITRINIDTFHAFLAKHDWSKVFVYLFGTGGCNRCWGCGGETMPPSAWHYNGPFPQIFRTQITDTKRNAMTNQEYVNIIEGQLKKFIANRKHLHPPPKKRFPTHEAKNKSFCCLGSCPALKLVLECMSFTSRYWEIVVASSMFVYHDMVLIKMVCGDPFPLKQWIPGGLKLSVRDSH